MKHEVGATLAVTLIMLLVITLLAVSSIQVAHMQEKMTANLQDKEHSFRAAESGIKAAETWLLSAVEHQPVTTCTSYPCIQTALENIDLALQSTDWWNTHSAMYSTELDNVATKPRYIIEFLQFVPDSPSIITGGSISGVYFYQVTARGTGSTNDSITVLQTTVARRF